MKSSGVVVWFTGLPASGKSTLARHVREQIAPRRPCVILDGDDLRTALGAGNYDDASRTAFYRSIRGLATLFAAQGLVVLVAATGSRREHRAIDRGATRVIEVYMRVPVEVCQARDPKGLYAAARAGVTTTLPGDGATYEPPIDPAVVAEGGEDARAVDALVEMLR